MRGPHDMGGLPAGTVQTEEHATTFFEKRVDAMRRLLSRPEVGLIATDENRRAIESLPDYAELGYYERWVRSMRILLVEKGVLTEAEIEARLAEIQRRNSGAAE